MSWKALTWASEQCCRTSSEKFVLVMLANHADEQDTCYPAVELLATETQLGESTVRRCIANLALDGKIRVLQRWGRRGSRRSNRYQLLLAGAATPLPEHDDWKHEYEYTPKPPVEVDGIPLAVSGIPDQGVNTAHSERFARAEDGIPLDPRGINLSIREVSTSKELISSSNPHPPTPQTGPAAAPPVDATAGEGEGDPFDEKTRQALSACVQRVRQLRPAWAPRSITAAMRQALDDGRAPEAVIAAMVVVAKDAATQVPGRLNTEGSWWGLGPARPARPASEIRRCPVPRHERQPAERCPLCAADAKAVQDAAAPVDPEVEARAAEYLRGLQERRRQQVPV